MADQKVSFKELAPGTLLQGGNYRIERVIGSGGFGITYFARHKTINQNFAIKEFFIEGHCVRNTMQRTVNLQGMAPEMYEKYRNRFVEEAKTLFHLNHPNIVKVIDVFEENNTSYIVMPFISGPTLEQLVRKQGPLDYGLTVNYLGQVAEAVGYIHRKNILHRDIKPDNIILTPDNKAVLIDFGSAREFIHDKTQHHTSILTKGYAPIEQYSSSSRKGSYTDIYSLGAVFYFAMTGHKPMDAATRLSDNMPEPVQLNPSINADANRTIMKAMQIKHEQRHQTIEEFMQDLLGQVPSTDGPAPSSAPVQPTPAEAPADSIPPKPSDYMPLAILSTLLCCLPFGVYTLVCSTQVGKRYYAGRYAEAEAASAKTRRRLIITLVAAALFWLLSLAGIGALVNLASSSIDHDSDPDYTVVDTTMVEEVPLEAPAYEAPAEVVQPTGSIESIDLEHNAYDGEDYGMRIHAHLKAGHLSGSDITLCALFYYGDNTTPLESPSADQLTICESGTVPYDEAEFRDFTLFVPYYCFDFGPDTDLDLSFDLTLTDPTSDTQLDRKNNTRFHYSN